MMRGHRETGPHAVPHRAARPRRRAKRLITAVLVLIVTGLLIATITVSPWAEVAVALTSADPVLMILALAAGLAVYPLWIWQWRLIVAPLHRVRWRVMAQIVALSIGARFTVSGLGGVASGGAALHSQAGLSPAEAAGVMTVDQALAGVAKLGVLALALVLAPVPDAVRAASLALAAALIGLAVLLALLPSLGRIGGGRFANAAARFATEFGRLLTARVLVPATLLAFAKKSLELAGAYAIQRALGIDASPVLAILAVASVSLVTLLPIAPVHLGPQALAVFTTYAALGVPTAEAISVAVLHQAMMLITTLGIGAVALVLTAVPPRAQPAP
jgi:glycosyltransferase 2 family protein